MCASNYYAAGGDAVIGSYLLDLYRKHAFFTPIPPGQNYVIFGLVSRQKVFLKYRLSNRLELVFISHCIRLYVQ